MAVVRSGSVFCALVLFFMCFNQSFQFEAKDITFVIISQEVRYHSDRAKNLQADILAQAKDLMLDEPEVLYTHIDFHNERFAWTILPLLPKLNEMVGDSSKIVMFLEDNTHVNLPRLVEVLTPYENHTRFIGYPLYDNEATLIHRFAFRDKPSSFKYPNPFSGIAITTKLLNLMADRASAVVKTGKDFVIDHAYELALFFKENSFDLTADESFCIDEEELCATWVEKFKTCGNKVEHDNMFFGVRTTHMKENERIITASHTWVPYAPHIRFFSDIEDPKAVYLGLPRVPIGHCQKTFESLRYIHNEITNKKMINIKWIILVNEETMLGVANMGRLLSCYNHKDKVIVGERNAFQPFGKKGFNYIVGNGGIAISRNLLSHLVHANCHCPSMTHPDDIFIGECLYKKLKTEIVHSPLFHQARPRDYAIDYLESQDNVVSFHKHLWQNQYDVFALYFSKNEVGDMYIPKKRRIEF